MIQILPPGNIFIYNTGLSGLATSGYRLIGQVHPDVLPHLSGQWFYSHNSWWDRKCGKCQGQIEGESCVTVTGTSGLYCTYHWHCAGFEYRAHGHLTGFQTKQDWIRDSAYEQFPWASGTPDYVVADLLDEQGRHRDAEAIRSSR